MGPEAGGNPTWASGCLGLPDAQKAGVLYVITASRSPGRSPASRSTVAARRAASANSR